MTSTRSIIRTGYAHRIEPVMPYAQYPQAYEESLVSPFSSHSYFGKGTWARSVRAAAESVRGWREQCEAMVEELERFRASSTSPWRERRLAIDGAAVVGSVRREARLHTYRIRIVSPSRAETLHSYDLAQQGEAVAGAGRHRFSVRVGETTHELTIRLSSLDHNGRMLAKLREAIAQAGLGLRVALLADSDRQLLSLEITGDEPFRLADLEGSLAASIGIARSSTAAEHARVVIDDGPVQESHGNLLLLDRGRLRLRLVEAGSVQEALKRRVAAGRVELEPGQPKASGRAEVDGALLSGLHFAGGEATQSTVNVRVESDTTAIRESIVSLLEGINLLLNPGSGTAEALNPMRSSGGGTAETLNPMLPQRVRHAMAHPACARLGIVKSKHDVWMLDERRLLPSLMVDLDRAERELAGPNGWAAQLQETLRRLLELPAREMMNPADHMMHQFTLYEASMQAYWHMPHSGWMINDQA
ncbi:hypothetical protein PA598K_03363 [Paenibacillus sp. 598K]|uniref:hypothetical protein n=1 Tax=Paenibacillus sp. 598K TaxID=1117987 RepID=UPI000FFA0E2B|nr:hypothetical protein [Paenibacillus sp. 598K]GBF74988.1 hypothetical protein PA598K_03363 [Paenibacillus sp. 598K]